MRVQRPLDGVPGGAAGRCSRTLQRPCSPVFRRGDPSRGDTGGGRDQARERDTLPCNGDASDSLSGGVASAGPQCSQPSVLVLYPQSQVSSRGLDQTCRLRPSRQNAARHQKESGAEGAHLGTRVRLGETTSRSCGDLAAAPYDPTAAAGSHRRTGSLIGNHVALLDVTAACARDGCWSFSF